MNKEEILARSKKENVIQDEREKDIRIHRDAFSGWGVVILGILIMILKLFNTQSPADIISILFCMSGLGFVYEGIHLRNKRTTIFGAVFLFFSVYFFYKFCMGLF